MAQARGAFSAAALRADVERLAERFSLPDGSDERLIALADLISADPLAPTTVREPLAVLRDHLADSLVALELGAIVTRARAVSYLGSGAGFPGLPLAIALPGANVQLVESSTRKCAFITRAIATLELPNASVVCARAESWREGRDSLDLVTARALAPLAVVAEYAAPLLRVGGSLVAWRGRRDTAAEEAAARAAHELGLELEQPREVRPYPQAEHRHLHVMSKIAATPPRFPRRPGVAAKRPLGGI